MTTDLTKLESAVVALANLLVWCHDPEMQRVTSGLNGGFQACVEAADLALEQASPDLAHRVKGD